MFCDLNTLKKKKYVWYFPDLVALKRLLLGNRRSYDSGWCVGLMIRNEIDSINLKIIFALSIVL